MKSWLLRGTTGVATVKKNGQDSNNRGKRRRQMINSSSQLWETEIGTTPHLLSWWQKTGCNWGPTQEQKLQRKWQGTRTRTKWLRASFTDKFREACVESSRRQAPLTSATKDCWQSHLTLRNPGVVDKNPLLPLSWRAVLCYCLFCFEW